MRFTKAMCLTPLLIFGLTPTLPPPHPVLSGTWDLDIGASNFGSGQAPTFSVTRKITQNDPEIDIEDNVVYPEQIENPSGTTIPLVIASTTHKESLKFFADGRTVTNITMDAVLSSTAQWKGQTLVISSKGVRSDNTKFTQDEIWSLATNGTSINIKQTTVAADFNSTSNLVLKKVP